MREVVEVTKTIEVKEIESQNAICNKSGKKIQVTNSDDFTHLNLRFGYASRFDGQSWRFDLSDEAMLDIVRTFKIVPEGFMLDAGEEMTQGQHQAMFDRWKKTGLWGYGDNEVKLCSHSETKTAHPYGYVTCKICKELINHGAGYEEN